MNMDGRTPIIRHKRKSFAVKFFNQLQRYKNLLLTRWWVLLIILVISLGIEMLILSRQPPSYMSEARMILGVKLSIPDANIYSEEFNNFFGTQVALMQSDSVTKRVNQSLQSTNPTWSSKPVSINVTLEPKTSIFNLRAVGGDMEYTRAYLQATMLEYINLKRDLLANASSATKSNIRDELAQMALELQKSKQELLSFQSSNSVVFLQQDGGNSAADYLSILSRQLAEHRAEFQLLKTLTLDENLERQQGIFTQPNSSSQPLTQNTTAAEAADGLPQNDPPQEPHPTAVAKRNRTTLNNMPNTLGGFEEAYLQAKQQILVLKAKRDQQAQFLRPKHPDIVAINEEISNQERLLEIFQGQSQEQLKNRQHTLEVQIKDLTNQVSEWELKALETSRKLSDFEVLKENHRRVQTLYDQLLATLQTLDVDKGIGQESVTILEAATPAVLAPRKMRNHLIMAGLVALMAGIGILLLLDRLDDRPASFAELEELFDKPILGQFPLIKAANKKDGVPILQLDDKRHMLVEAYCSLRSALVFKHSPTQHPRSIVITSASPNDGKSTIAANFAITLAQSGARVLLVDADLRRGTLHRHFSISASPGLAEVLAEKCEWSKTVVPTAIPNLFVLPCGALPRNPGSLFAMKASSFLTQIAGQYDYYLFDTAPVMAADDVSSLAPHVDGLIMVIRAGFTSGRIAQAALDLLHLRKVNVIGLVFNAVQPNAREYYYFRDANYFPQSNTTS
jgi:capsular exopolysaccharide synthesis family protein